MKIVLLLIVISLIGSNVSGYIVKSSIIGGNGDDDEGNNSFDDQQQLTSTIIDSTPVEDDQPQQSPELPELNQSPTQPEPQSIPVTTVTVIKPDNQLNEIDLVNLVKPKLIGRSSHFDHKEDSLHRMDILSNTETYQLPSNDLLIRSQIISNIYWIIKRGDGQLKPQTHQQQQQQQQHQHQQHQQQQQLNQQDDDDDDDDNDDDDDSQTITLATVGRRKRQADGMMTTNQDGDMMGGMGQNGQPMKPMDPNNRVNPIVERFRAIYGRFREMISELRGSWQGNRVDTKMNGNPTRMSEQQQQLIN